MLEFNVIYYSFNYLPLHCDVTILLNSGLVQLACLFLPKIYIVVFTPEKNTKEVVMGHARTASFTTPTPSPGTPASNTERVVDDNGKHKVLSKI